MAATSVIPATRPELSVNPFQSIRIPDQQPALVFTRDVPSLPIAHPTQLTPLASLTTAAESISHDFRHHLCAIYANAELLGGRSMKSADREELLHEIRLAINGMTDQLDSLLRFTRTGCTFKPRRQSLRVIIEQAIQMVRSHPATRHVTIIHHDMSPPEGYMDGMQLSSALFNLLLNACQAAQLAAAMKTVDIHLLEDCSDVFLRVLDRGPGVAHAACESLFKPFVKAEASKGLGLGLTIARAIAQGHGGDVYLEESRPGRTVFVLRLPKALFA